MLVLLSPALEPVGEGGSRNMWVPIAGIPPIIPMPLNSALYGSVSRRVWRLDLVETRVVSELLALDITWVDLDLRKSESILVRLLGSLVVVVV